MRTILPFLALAGCVAGPPAFSDADREAIMAQRAVFLEALTEGEVARAVSIYSEDTFVMPANAPPVSGKIALMELFTAMPPVGSATFYGDRFIPAGDMVMVVGNYAMTTLLPGTDLAVADTGKYVEVWRREDDAWRLAWDIWNSNRPLPVPPPAGTAAPR